MGMGLVFLTVFLAVMSSSTRVSAQTSCTTALISMSPCLNYITGNSTSPSQQCCRQLSSVVQSSPDCLCQVLNGGGSQLGININQTQALELPKACNVQTPPVSRCNNGKKNFQPKKKRKDCFCSKSQKSYEVLQTILQVVVVVLLLLTLLQIHQTLQDQEMDRRPYQ